jgi:hypothetical protein
MPCSLLDRYQSFERICSFHLQAAGSFATLVTAYKTAKRHLQADSDTCLHRLMLPLDVT